MTDPGSISLVATPYLPRTSSWTTFTAEEKPGKIGLESSISFLVNLSSEDCTLFTELTCFI